MAEVLLLLTLWIVCSILSGCVWALAFHKRDNPNKRP